MATLWKRALGIVLTALVVAFVGLEVNLRLFGGPIEIFNPLNGFHDGDPVLGWRGKKDIERRFHRPEFDVLVGHDEEGFRRPDPERPAHPRRKILILGDSIVWGWGVEQGELFSDHLQRALAPEVAIYNRGVNAYSTGQELLLLRQEIDKRDYDTVLVLVSRTDIGDNIDDKKHRPAFDLVDGELVARNQPPPGRLKNPVERFVDDHSYAINFLSWQLAHMKRGEKAAEWMHADAPPTPPNFESEPGYGVTKRLLEQIAAVCREHGVRLVFAYGTTFLEQRDTMIESGFRKLVADVAESEGAGFVELSGPLQTEANAGNEILFPGDKHWNAAGHRTASDAILASGVLAQ